EVAICYVLMIHLRRPSKATIPCRLAPTSNLLIEDFRLIRPARHGLHRWKRTPPHQVQGLARRVQPPLHSELFSSVRDTSTHQPHRTSIIGIAPQPGRTLQPRGRPERTLPSISFSLRGQ